MVCEYHFAILSFAIINEKKPNYLAAYVILDLFAAHSLGAEEKLNLMMGGPYKLVNKHYVSPFEVEIF